VGAGGAGGAGGAAAAGPATPQVPAAAPAQTQAGACETPGAAAEAEGNDAHTNATRIGPGQAVSGAIGHPEDKDWFVIETCGEKLIRVQLTNAPATSTPVDFQLQLFGPDGEDTRDTIADHDGTDGITQLERVYYVESGEKVYLMVRDISSDEWDSQHPYRLTVTVMPVPDAEIEPNGNKNDDTNRALATPLPPSTPTRAFLASQEDHDWFKVEVPSESLLRIELSNAPATRSDADYNFSFMDVRGEELRGETDHDGDDGITTLTSIVYAETPGTYFLRVRDAGGDDWDLAAGYTVTLTLVAVTDGEAEPNGNKNDDTNRQLATALTLGQDATGYLAWPDDHDFYRIDATAAGTLRIRLTTVATSTEIDLNAEVQDARGEDLGSETDHDGSDGMTNVELSVQLPSPGRYFIKIRDAGGDDWDVTNAYTLNASM
jgi:hypothetical protein